jgi:hypothetical protein
MLSAEKTLSIWPLAWPLTTGCLKNCGKVVNMMSKAPGCVPVLYPAGVVGENRDQERGSGAG